MTIHHLTFGAGHKSPRPGDGEELTACHNGHRDAVRGSARPTVYLQANESCSQQSSTAILALSLYS